MQGNLPSITPQFIKTDQYNQDYVQNSFQIGSHQKRNNKNQQIYRSPPQKDYQSRYPASFHNNYNQKNQPYIRISPPKNNINSRNTNSREYHHFQIAQNAQNRNYISPQRNNSYHSTPYAVNSPSYQSKIDNPFMSSNQYQSNKSVIELQRLVSQLKISLQQSISIQSSLQQQLHKQKSRTFQLSQIKRKLEQQLSKMEFQLERISNIDYLAQRQIYVKYEAQLMQNERLNSQVNDLMEQLKRVKKQYRQQMSEGNKFKEQCDLLRNDNLQLIDKMQLLVKEVSQMKQQLNISGMRQRQLINQNLGLKNNHNYQFQNSQYNIQNIPGSNNYIQYENSHMMTSQLNNITTTRTNNQSSNHLSQGHIQSPTRFKQSFQQSPQTTKPNSSQYQKIVNKNINSLNSPLLNNQKQINYQIESSKLIQDYNRLLMQNSSMKQLYKQFYNRSPQKNQNMNQIINSPPHSYNTRSISEHSQEFQSTDRKLYSNNNQNLSPRLQTFQKNQLYQQISSLRQQVIDELIKNYFRHSAQQAQNKKQNVLVIFIKLLSRNLLTIQKMVINYLQARDLLKKQLKVKRLNQGQQSQPSTTTQFQVEGMWQKIKNKLKTQIKQHKKQNFVSNQMITLNINAYFLALFRLLTLINRHQNVDIQNNSKTLSKLKHSALKYVHKIYQESNLIKRNINQVKNDKTDNARSLSKKQRLKIFSQKMKKYNNKIYLIFNTIFHIFILFKKIIFIFTYKFFKYE